MPTVAPASELPGLPPLSRASERNAGWGRRLLRAGGALVLLAIGLVTLLFIGVEVGPVALATGLVLATIPAPVYVWLALRVDRFEPEPLRLLAWSFFWGATAATFIALILNTTGQAVVGANFGSEVGELYGNSISAPVVEEGAKAAVLFALFRWRRAEWDGVLDGLVYAAMVGLGFAMTENVLYYGKAAVEGGVPLVATFFVRGVMAPFAHPVFTAMTGIGLGLAAHSRGTAARRLTPLVGLLAAMVLHSMWNTSAGVGGGAAFIGVFFLIMVPVFAALLVVVAAARRREARVIGSQLGPEVGAGVLAAGDVLVLSRLGERRRLARAARRDGGAARRTCRQWMDAATDLAFLRHRAQRGLPTGSAAPEADEAALVERLRRLRAALGPQAAGALQAAGQGAAGLAVTAQAPGQPAAGLPAAPAGVAAPTGPALPPAAWYADPWGQSRWRWWDGSNWTHHVG